ncbi:hypothetical protein FZI51_12710 [Cronobacter sakazakii]|nr:hypothetical protein FZI51_12710 [Cronobacter sakazakii]
MSLFAQKSRPEMVATIYGSSQAQLSERLGLLFARAKRIKKPRISEADIALLLMMNLRGGCPATLWHCDRWT